MRIPLNRRRMMRRLGYAGPVSALSRISCLALVFFVHAAIAQTISDAYIGKDGKARVVFANGAVKIMRPERQQVGCDNISMDSDKRAVAWSVLVDNCCTSYPIPIAVVVYRYRKKTVIYPGQMIWKWRFVREEQIAVLSGPVHGWAARANLYSIQSGRVLESWNGKGDAPEWAKDWADEFEQ